LSADPDGSYRRAAQAWQSGLFTPEIAPVTHTTKKGPLTITEDEEFKALKLEKVPSLKPAFKKDGTVTAANASSINDGASALVLSTLDKSKELSGKPIARILAWADAATKPIDFTIAPSLAIPIALKRAGLEVKDIAKWELNEVPPKSTLYLVVLTCRHFRRSRLRIRGFWAWILKK
jgi:acetyl-CoA C-acetyltransferase